MIGEALVADYTAIVFCYRVLLSCSAIVFCYRVRLSGPRLVCFSSTSVLIIFGPNRYLRNPRGRSVGLPLYEFGHFEQQELTTLMTTHPSPRIDKFVNLHI
jgi:hypothetical protein